MNGEANDNKVAPASIAEVCLSTSPLTSDKMAGTSITSTPFSLFTLPDKYVKTLPLTKSAFSASGKADSKILPSNTKSLIDDAINFSITFPP